MLDSQMLTERCASPTEPAGSPPPSTPPTSSGYTASRPTSTDTSELSDIEFAHSRSPSPRTRAWGTPFPTRGAQVGTRGRRARLRGHLLATNDMRAPIGFRFNVPPPEYTLVPMRGHGRIDFDDPFVDRDIYGDGEQ